MADYYQILGLDRSATLEEIKKSFRKKALLYHPDKSGGDKESEDMFKKINEAYETLSDTEKRKNYDNPNIFKGRGFSGNPFKNPFSDIYGGFGNQSNNLFNRGKNIQARIEISLQDVINGIIKKASIYRRIQCFDCRGTGAKNAEVETCVTCNGMGSKKKMVQSNFGSMYIDESCHLCSGSGTIPKSHCQSCQGSGTIRKPEIIEINIPKGSVNGVSFNIPGKGDMEKSPSDPGDLIVSIIDKPDELFKRDGINLLYEKNISFPEACLGFEALIPNPGGIGDFKIKVPPGTQPNKIFRLVGKGVPEFNNDFFGDILVRINVKVPTELNEEQKTLIDKYKIHFEL